MIIAIDGPTASGKSTIARTLAHKLGFYFVSSGLFYRALAYVLSRDPHYMPEQVHRLSHQDIYTFVHKLVYRYNASSGASIVYETEDITPYLKDKNMDYLSSIIATSAPVRHELMMFQRMLAQKKDIVMEGRDIGSVVFPNADVKFFITASEEERARRWQRDQAEKGNSYLLQECITIISDRDKRDRERVLCPLIVAPGAVVIDTTHLTKEETLQKMLVLIHS
jgi:cytidylate kinase